MTTQEIIKSLREEGHNASRISEILGVTNVKDYEQGQPASYRVFRRLKRNYQIYQLINLCDAQNTQMGRPVQK